MGVGGGGEMTGRGWGNKNVHRRYKVGKELLPARGKKGQATKVTGERIPDRRWEGRRDEGGAGGLVVSEIVTWRKGIADPQLE